jgi:Zn-dependent M28 family amino/carboxypeptidase
MVPPPRFDMMGKRLYKTYVDLTNIVIRISDGTPAGKEHAILVNSHVDSTLPSPGAADDGLAVGVMLDCMRVLINSPDWSPRYAIVLRKFNSRPIHDLRFLNVISVQ